MLTRNTRKARHIDAPQRHQNHRRPITRRELIGQGFLAGSATVLGGGILSLFSNPRAVYAAIAADLDPLRAACGISVFGAGKIPFICFDLAGGANMASSNVLVGGKTAATPLGRGTTPQEICDAVRFLLAAPALTGQMIALDGGQHLGWAHPEPGAAPEE